METGTPFFSSLPPAPVPKPGSDDRGLGHIMSKYPLHRSPGCAEGVSLCFSREAREVNLWGVSN